MSNALCFIIVVCCLLLVQEGQAAKSSSEVGTTSSEPEFETTPPDNPKTTANPESRRYLNPAYYGTANNQLGYLAQYFDEKSSSSESKSTEVPDRCHIDERKRHRRPAKSFPEKNLPPPNKVYRSAHAGEDLVICWTESVVMKEDRSNSLAKRMIHREYTISFETEAIIPEEHLDCPRIPNEIEASSEETAKFGVFEEAIIDNTRQSKFMPYAMREEDNDIVTTEQKIVRCASGSYIVRDVQEWRKPGRKPIKRMQITVKPLIKYADNHPQARVPAEDPLDELFNYNCTLSKTPENFPKPPTNSEEDTEEETTTPPEAVTSFTGKTATPSSADMVCDNSTGRCGISEETVTPTISTTIDSSEPDDNITTTAETRSTWPVFRPKLILKINVVLERVNENEEKEQLMQVDKEVALRDEFGNNTIMDKIKALNDSVNDIETLRDLLNVLNDVGANRSKRSVNKHLQNVRKHMQNVRVVEESLPDIREDIQTGLNEIVGKIEEKEGKIKKGVAYPTKASNFDEEGGKRSRRSVEGAVGRWSNVRVKKAAGERIRSFTELVVVEN